MDPRHQRIAPLAAAALLFRVALALGIAPTAGGSAVLGCNNTCSGQTPNIKIQFPFGFSSGCPIQLNCTPDGTVLIGEFPVQEIDSYSGSISVNVSARCDRPFGTIDQLYGRNFAPKSNNEVFLGNCTQPSPCDKYLPTCSMSLENVSCYTVKESGSEFLSFGKLSEMKCGIFTSSTSEWLSNSLYDETMLLAWWVSGEDCRCSGNAICTLFPSVPAGGNGYRCQCSGDGDGYLDGSGCHTAGFNWLLVMVPLSVVIGSAVVGILLYVCVCRCIRGKCWPRRRNLQEDVDTLMRCHGSSLPRSYGMLLFEMIGGKDRTGVETSKSSEMYFPDWVYKHLESGKPLWMSEINSPEDEEIARKMMIVSLWCIQTHPSDRPSMSMVIDMLEGSSELLGMPPVPLSIPQRGLALNGSTTTLMSSEQMSLASVRIKCKFYPFRGSSLHSNIAVGDIQGSDSLKQMGENRWETKRQRVPWPPKPEARPRLHCSRDRQEY
ncbi:hypothetical protein MLD38_034687 [Melastoma candidum]|uniref:Uncharacterized protein n=1 Tax=Melastoma candidum TaxID=119954 RepID=A0ACB9MC28_9MYRT|nr:hypothetical protein MLD38_034687 [Melastoma candidum]